MQRWLIRQKNNSQFQDDFTNRLLRGTLSLKDEHMKKRLCRDMKQTLDISGGKIYHILAKNILVKFFFKDSSGSNKKRFYKWSKMPFQ